MMEMGDAFAAAAALIIDFESGLAEIVLLSLQVSMIAVVMACFIGLPVGAALAIFQFPGRTLVVVVPGRRDAEVRAAGRAVLEQRRRDARARGGHGDDGSSNAKRPAEPHQRLRLIRQ